MPSPLFQKLSSPWSATLRDRRQVVIRPFWVADPNAWPDLLGDPYRACRHLSFFGRISGGKPLPADPEGVSSAKPRLYAAMLHENDSETLVGMGKFQPKHRGLGCECVIAVLATQPSTEVDALLMRYLIGLAHSQGMRDLASESSATNTQPSELLHQLGFRARTDPTNPAKLIHELAS